MSNLLDHAKKELKLAGLFDGDADYGGHVAQAVMELLGVFSKQGHSGSSANLVAGLFSRLVNHETLTQLTGKNNEWQDISVDDAKDTEGIEYQNVRNTAVFKDKRTGKVTYTYAIVFVEESGGSFIGTARMPETGEDVRSSMSIKSFPFMPKSFYVKVDDLGNILEPEKVREALKYYGEEQ